MCKLAAEVLGIDEKDVAVASTGVIGVPLNIEPIQKNIKTLIDNLGNSKEHAQNAAAAIMTTDTFMKEIAYEFEIDGK